MGRGEGAGQCYRAETVPCSPVHPTRRPACAHHYTLGGETQACPVLADTASGPGTHCHSGSSSQAEKRMEQHSWAEPPHPPGSPAPCAGLRVQGGQHTPTPDPAAPKLYPRLSPLSLGSMDTQVLQGRNPIAPSSCQLQARRSDPPCSPRKGDRGGWRGSGRTGRESPGCAHGALWWTRNRRQGRCCPW